jgi:O-antigen ligase
MDAGNNAADTSISLGYVAELYVDFGIVGALAAVFVLGVIFGRSVKYLSSPTKPSAIVNSGLALMLMMTVFSFDQAFIKMIGGFLTTFAVILVLRSVLLPYLLNKYGPKATSNISLGLPQGARDTAAGV